MPKRRTDDAVHVVITDHLIRRSPQPSDLKPKVVAFFMPGAALTEETSAKEKPLSPILTGKRFIGGAPMKLATKMDAGFS